MFLILYIVSFNRKMLKCFTLSDGTHLPQGTLIAAPMLMFSTDPDLFENPEIPDGFRWYKKSLEAEGRATHNAKWTTTSPRDLGFGHGKPACSGRFFVSEETKILAFLVLRYDFQYPEGQSRPATLDHGESLYPDIILSQSFFSISFQAQRKFPSCSSR